MVDCEPAILREVVSLALAGVPGIVLLGNGSDDADVVVASNPPSTFGGPSLLRSAAKNHQYVTGGEVT